MTRTMQRRAILAAILILGASALAAGCGRKGPLYLPENAAAPPVPAAAPAPAGEPKPDGDDRK